MITKDYIGEWGGGLPNEYVIFQLKKPMMFGQSAPQARKISGITFLIQVIRRHRKISYGKTASKSAIEAYQKKN